MTDVVLPWISVCDHNFYIGEQTLMCGLKRGHSGPHESSWATGEAMQRDRPYTPDKIFLTWVGSADSESEE